MNDCIVSLDQITKNYQSQKALDSISFNIPTGTIFGLLGPNGAGKTSLIRILANIILPDSGTVVFNGADRSKNIGYLPEERGLYKSMYVGEQLEYLCRLKSVDKYTTRAAIKHWAQKLEFEAWLKKPVDSLSKGMQQKIQFVSAVLHKPSFLILDEPFSGFDPINTQLIQNEMNLLVQNGTTILLSTHRLEQAEELCSHISMLNHGKLVLNGDLKEIKKQIKTKIYVIESDQNLEPENKFYKVNNQSEGFSEITIKTDNTNLVIQNIMDQTVLSSFAPKKPNLSELFQQYLK